MGSRRDNSTHPPAGANEERGHGHHNESHRPAVEETDAESRHEGADHLDEEGRLVAEAFPHSFQVAKHFLCSKKEEGLLSQSGRQIPCLLVVEPFNLLAEDGFQIGLSQLVG